MKSITAVVILVCLIHSLLVFADSEERYTDVQHIVGHGEKSKVQSYIKLVADLAFPAGSETKPEGIQSLFFKNGKVTSAIPKSFKIDKATGLPQEEPYCRAYSKGVEENKVVTYPAMDPEKNAPYHYKLENSPSKGVGWSFDGKENQRVFRMSLKYNKDTGGLFQIQCYFPDGIDVKTLPVFEADKKNGDQWSIEGVLQGVISIDRQSIVMGVVPTVDRRPPPSALMQSGPVEMAE